jgi:hypothetical protein
LNYTDPTGLKEISAEDLNNEDAAKGISEQKEVSKQYSSESGKYLGEIIWDFITKPVTDLKDRVLRSGAMINKSVELQVLAIISGDPSRAAMYGWEAAAIMKGAEYEAYAAVAQATKIGIDVAAIGASGAPGSIAEDMLAAPAANLAVKAAGNVVDDATGNAENPLSQQAQRAIQKIDNAVRDHVTPGDLAGTGRDMLGNPVPRPAGGFYDHMKEMTETLGGLRKNIGILEQVSNQAAQQAVGRARTAIQTIVESIKGIGI